MEKKKTSARLIKKRKKVQIKVPTKTKTAMYLSKKTTTKKLTIQKRKKNGLNTSKEVPKRPKIHGNIEITCWIEAHRRLKWRMARRIAFLPKETWTSKNFDRHPGFGYKVKTRRLAGRPKRRWEDDINEFMRSGETKDERKYDLMNNSSWMTEAKNYKE